MARENSRSARSSEERRLSDDSNANGKEVNSLLSHGSREGSPDSDIVVHPANAPFKPPHAPRRQSSFAQHRPNGEPRTPNRVRFEVADALSEDGGVNDRDHANGWIEEEDYMSSNGYADRRDSTGQRAPLLTDIEAPSVTVAEDLEFSAEDLLESARPKSGMRSAFMNMANSIM